MDCCYYLVQIVLDRAAIFKLSVFRQVSKTLRTFGVILVDAPSARGRCESRWQNIDFMLLLVVILRAQGTL